MKSPPQTSDIEPAVADDEIRKNRKPDIFFIFVSPISPRWASSLSLSWAASLLAKSVFETLIALPPLHFAVAGGA